jgi:N-methylhydantoinase A
VKLVAPHLQVGIDIGGTFTDFVVLDESNGSIRAFKILSTVGDPSRSVLEGLHSLLPEQPRMIIHGSTVATNALLERKGAKTAFIATRGFRDLLTIGRQNRPNLYDWFPERPQPLISDDCCLEITERMDSKGFPITPLDEGEIAEVLQRLQTHQVESVAVTFLFSFVNSAHERIVVNQIREAGWFVTASHELIPEFREFERASTSVVNAYVSPVLDRYIGKLAKAVAPAEFHILQSNGGRLPVSLAGHQGVRSILSGPAGGVVGARHVARLVGFEQVITFDMGGTSTDVSMVQGPIPITNEAKIGGFPIRVPVIDIHTIGAGGGSLAEIDQGGALRVGPESAGSDPGPVCYGLGGDRATVTDANLCLGRLSPEGLLGGTMRLDARATEEALESLARHLGSHKSQTLTRTQRMAKGIIDVINVQMERALRVISVERGYDPRDCILVSFGGAGGLHACELAKNIGIRKVLVPPLASTLSALGMLVADTTMDFSQTVMCSEDLSLEKVQNLFGPLLKRSQAEVLKQFPAKGEFSFFQELDIRYVGQSFELSVPVVPQFRDQFDRCHEERFGFCKVAHPIELVTIRVKAVCQTIPPVLPHKPLGPPSSYHAVLGSRHVVLGEDIRSLSVYDRNLLHPGNTIEGPALIVQPDTTTFLSDKALAKVDGYYNLVIDVGLIP